MFVHQVIEDLQRFEPDLAEQLYPPLTILKLTNTIKTAQKFNLDDVEGLADATNIMKEKVSLFCGSYMGNVRLPYKTCWFDYLRPEEENGQKIKTGLLTLENKNDYREFTVLLFYYFPHLGYWIPGNFQIGLTIRKEVSTSNWKRAAFLKRAEASWNNKDVEIEAYKALLAFDLTVLNSALLFLDCKNIGTKEILPSDALNRKRIKSNKIPLFSYHTLIIKPVTRRQKSVPQHLWQNRIHLCRGHFKVYTDANPLFGKIIGRFWWQPHVAGRSKGAVLKDYQIGEA